ncbi:hypothetical protein [Actinacidiphila reveromycinica]|nr:hypothetical protein [Streptomyces sp. SN-593]
MISHRLGATHTTAHILVLDGGRIIEEDTHESLLNPTTALN